MTIFNIKSSLTKKFILLIIILIGSKILISSCLNLFSTSEVSAGTILNENLYESSNYSLDNSDKSNNNIKFYTNIKIQENDTLWDIESRYNNGSDSKKEYINKIMTLNNMNDTTLYNGQNLIIFYNVVQQ